ASTFEGEASTALMYHAELYEKENGSAAANYNIYGVLTKNDAFVTLNTNAFAAYLAEECAKSGDTDRLAYEFHAVLADMVLEACVKIREKHKINICALSGGVFQNRLLVKMCKNRLENAGFEVLIHSVIPPNDGGICLGQAAYGAVYQ
ncbi:MAG: carbamoyltransferase HypF, partial [Firmicutes bacterium]|nr:carbamoyltransferase HypF [Bacillota bacterium]